MWNDTDLQKIFLNNTPLIDVRSPVEFELGIIPHSINLPIINNEERHEIGLCYKSSGKEAATMLGHQLVSGKIKENRITLWKDNIKKNPQTEIFCFRGGLRSKITCEWLSHCGYDKTPIPGGYKRMRNFFLSLLNESPIPPIYRIGGLTGTGKTSLLKFFPNHIDLEECAHHRGSAFGNRGKQPTQVTFENQLAFEILKMKKYSHFFLEDESINIGSIIIPNRFYQEMRQAPIIFLETPIEERISNIYKDYVLQKDVTFFSHAVEKISRRLGGLRTKDLQDKIQQAFAKGDKLTHHQEWISILLKDYYDVIYQRNLLKQQNLIQFQGTKSEILDWIKSLYLSK